jgi:hypothetical protein
MVEAMGYGTGLDMALLAEAAAFARELVSMPEAEDRR